MTKIILPFLLMIFMMTGCTGGKLTEPTNTFKTDRKITIGLDDDYAPISFRNAKGEIVGFDVDLAKKAAELMGVAVEFKAIDWSRKEEELNAGNIDMIWSGMDITPKRKEHMLFSKPYMDNRQILLVRKGNPHNIHSVGDLDGKIVGTQDGSTAQLYVEDSKDLKSSLAEFKIYPTFKAGLAALSNKEIDVLIIDEIVGRYGMAREPDKFEPIEVTIGSATRFGIGFRKDNTKLRDEVQVAFDKLVADGTAQDISLKWFDADLIKSRK